MHWLESVEIFPIKSLIFILENFHNLDGIFEKVVADLRLEVRWQYVQQLIYLIFLACMNQIVIILLEKRDELAAQFFIQIRFMYELFDNGLLGLVLLFAFLLSEYARQL